jgi:hypothetical protein
MTKFILPSLSSEQAKVIDYVKSRNNIIVDAVAGSGKTTTILHIARAMSDFKILVITYNARLKLETREKSEKLKLKNIEVHSYHSFGVKYYSKECCTDKGIIEAIECTNNKKIPKYDILIIDEAQDMNELYYKFITVVIYCINNIHLQLCILGDKNQSIYDFNYADKRFITNAMNIYPQLTRKWTKCTMSTNYRSTIEICTLINKCVLNEDRLKAVKHGQRPKYIICNVRGRDKYNKIYKEVKKYLKIYKSEDIFILSPSVKSAYNPARICANAFSKNCPNIKIYVPNSEESKIDPKIIKGKIVFSTYHQVKGLERKVVIVIGFDISYFFLYAKNKSRDICPDTVYVALTRAIEHLIIIHDTKWQNLPFVNYELIKKYADVVMYDGMINSIPTESLIKKTFVTRLISHMPSEILYKCVNLLEYKTIQKKGALISLTPMINNEDETCELVCDINGIAIPSYFQFKTQNKMSICKMLIEHEYKTFFKKTLSDIQYNNVINSINFNSKYFNVHMLLKISNVYISRMHEYIYHITQINEYDWLDNCDNEIDVCFERLKKIGIGYNSTYEFGVSEIIGKYNCLINGQIDCIDDDNKIIYEFKCVSELKPEHRIQLAIYAHIVSRTEKKYKGYKYRLMNILSDEIYELDVSNSDIDKMMELILHNKYGDKTHNKDDKFISEMLEFSNKFILKTNPKPQFKIKKTKEI